MAARKVVVSGQVYSGKNRDGDYAWMVKQPQYQTSVFIVMENFLDMIYTSDNGGGTAAFRSKTWPTAGEGAVAVGVPTGWSQETNGFKHLDHTVKGVIDCAIARLCTHLHLNPHVTRIVYSADEKDPRRVGSKIFKVDDAVLQYISDRIHAVPDLVRRNEGRVYPTLAEIRTKEIKKYAQLAQAFHERDRALRSLRELQEKHAVGAKRPREAASSSAPASAGIMRYMK